MKACCVLLLDTDGNSTQFSPWLVLGKTYHILSVIREEEGQTWFRLLTNEREVGPESVGLYRAECFELTSNYRPTSWRERKLERGGIETSPVAWQVEGFWESFYERDPMTLIEFQIQFRLIVEEEM